MKPESKGTTVQTLIFDKKVFKTAKAAKAWAKKHDFKAGAVDETDETFRIRQREPGDFEDDSFRTISLTKGVKAVIGKLKSTKSEGKHTRSVKAQYADDALVYCCNSLVNGCTVALREIDEESELVSVIEEALICAVLCSSHFSYWDEATLAERIGACNKLSECCEALLQALGEEQDDQVLKNLQAYAQMCFDQAAKTAGTEEEEGDGPAHPEDYDQGEETMTNKTAVSKAKLKVKASWNYGFKVAVRNEAEMDAAVMTISGPIGFSYEDDSGTSAKEFSNALAKIPTERDIKVRINSEGGSMQDGLEMFNGLKERGEKVTTINDGYALSCASLLLLAGHTRVTPKSSLVMIHTPRLETYGDAEEHEKAIAMLKSHQEMMADVYAEELGITTDEAHDLMEAETWLTGKEMVDAGWSQEEEDDDKQEDKKDQDHDQEQEEQDKTKGSLRNRLVAVVAMHRFNPPEHIRQIISARNEVGGGAGSAASKQTQNQNNMSEKNPVAAAPTADLEKRFQEERKMRITGEINRRAEGKIKNDQIGWWFEQAMNAPTAEAEKAIYAQLEALPVAAAPGGAALRPDSPEAKTDGERPPVFEITPASGCSARPSKRLPWMEEIRKLKGSHNRAVALSRDWAGRVNYCLELDARENRGQVVAANSFSATLITDFLVDTAVTILINRWASLSAFSIEFGPDRYKEYATAQVKFVTSAGSTLKGTKSSPITNFEQGDATVVPISVPMTHYVKSFNVSQEDLMSGLRVENLMQRNLGQLADDVTIDALEPIAGNTAGYASFQQPGPQNSAGSLVNFTAGTIHVNAGTFGWNAGQTDGHDLAAMWAYLKKSPTKHLILDGNFYGRLTNSPGYFQMPFGADERGGGDRIKTFGWDRLEENTAWPAIVDAAGNAIGGFVCAPQAIVGVTGLPQVPPSIPGAVLQETVVTLPGPDVSISMFTWFALQARKLWTSFELMGGFAGGDASAGAVIFNGKGSVS